MKGLVDGPERFPLVCDCGDLEHLLVFQYFPGDEDAVMFVSSHLNPARRWWSRVWTVVKFMFGWRSTFGEYDELVVQSDALERLILFLSAALEQFRATENGEGTDHGKLQHVSDPAEGGPRRTGPADGLLLAGHVPSV